MFHNTTHLPQRLENDDYSCPDRFQKELDRLFLKGWQFIGDTSQLTREGDFFTTEIFGRPLICWLQNGEPETFLNVCSHRLCTLTDKAAGHFAGRMKCQYHGWEFDCQGNTCKIPDAQSFRPLTKQLVQLKKYRTERVGKLIFVSFEEDPPALKEYLGATMYDRCTEWFSDRYIPTMSLDRVLDCNWKVIVENALESYHIETMHTKTFKQAIPAEDLYHRFYDYGSELLMDYAQWGADRHLEWAINRWFGMKPTYNWRHMLRYPNIFILNSSLVTYIQAVVPISPTSSLSMMRIFNYAGDRPSLRNWLGSRMLRIGAKKTVGTVVMEDYEMYPNIQKGLSADAWPGEGLISVREERLFEFQEYLLRELDRNDDRDPSVSDRSLARPLNADYEELVAGDSTATEGPTK